MAMCLCVRMQYVYMLGYSGVALWLCVNGCTCNGGCVCKDAINVCHARAHTHTQMAVAKYKYMFLYVKVEVGRVRTVQEKRGTGSERSPQPHFNQKRSSC